jgi:hypothetical protein
MKESNITISPLKLKCPKSRKAGLGKRNGSNIGRCLKAQEKKNKCFSVNFKDLADKKKNPNFKLGAESILKNEKIKKKSI